MVLFFLLAIPFSLNILMLYLNRKGGAGIYGYLTLLSALISIFILLALPAFRGYPFYGAGDTMAHLGMIRDISDTGYTGSKNVYPVIHILLFSLSGASRLSPEELSLYMTSGFFVLFVASMMILARSLRCSQLQVLSIASVATLPTLGYWLTVESIMPSTESFFMIPLALSAVIRSRNAETKFEWSLIVILLFALLPFFHFESALFLLFLLSAIMIALRYSLQVGQRVFLARSGRLELTTSWLLLFTCYIAVFSVTAAFGNTVGGLYDSMILGHYAYPTTMMTVSAGNFPMGLMNATLAILVLYGSAFACLAIGLILSARTIRKKKNDETRSQRDILLSSMFFCMGLVNLFFFTTGTPIGYHMLRQLKYPLMISTIMMGLFLLRSFQEKMRSGAYKVPLVIFIVFVAIILPTFSVFTVYPNGLSYSANYQPTYADINGMSFFFEKRDQNILIYEVGDRAYQTRYSEYLIGFESYIPGVRWAYSNETVPPPHFGYDKEGMIGHSYSSSIYLLIYPPAKEFYPTFYSDNPELWRFTPSDFQHLDADPSLDRILSNNNLDIFLSSTT